MTSTAERYARHVDPAFVKLLGVLGYGRVFTRAEGSWVWDEQRPPVSRSARRLRQRQHRPQPSAAGRAPARVLRRRAAESQPHRRRPPYAAAARRGARARRGRRSTLSLFATSGAEAVEAAMKLARAATRRTRIVYCEGAYHGLSLGTLSVSATTRMRAPFEPLLPGLRCRAVRRSRRARRARSTTGRRRVPRRAGPDRGRRALRSADGYLRAARELCTKHGTLLVLDEVQTGFGRTGSRCSRSSTKSATPDVLVLAKSAGGSIAPIGVTLTTRAIQRKALRLDAHASICTARRSPATRSRAPPRCETLRIIEDEDLVARSRDRGATHARGAARAAATGIRSSRDIRGRGLLVAIELRRRRAKPATLAGQWLALALLERGLIVQPASQAWNVLRLEPPLTIRREAHDRERRRRHRRRLRRDIARSRRCSRRAACRVVAQIARREERFR